MYSGASLFLYCSPVSMMPILSIHIPSNKCYNGRLGISDPTSIAWATPDTLPELEVEMLKSKFIRTLTT